MPQQWTQHWPLPFEDRDSSELKEQRDNAVRELGNLTLVTQKLNSNLSNGPWEEKKKALHSHSSLFLNRNLLDSAPDEWNESAIRERSAQLAKLIVQIWPHGDAM